MEFETLLMELAYRNHKAMYEKTVVTAMTVLMIGYRITRIIAECLQNSIPPSQFSRNFHQFRLEFQELIAEKEILAGFVFCYML